MVLDKGAGARGAPPINRLAVTIAKSQSKTLCKGLEIVVKIQVKQNRVFASGGEPPRADYSLK